MQIVKEMTNFHSAVLIYGPKEPLRHIKEFKNNANYIKILNVIMQLQFLFLCLYVKLTQPS